MVKPDRSVKIPISKETYNDLIEFCREHKVPLKFLLHQLSIYPNMAEQLLSYPSTITEQMLLSGATVLKLLPLWMKNVRDNFIAIKNGNDVSDIPDGIKIPALVIGAGPSLYRRKHLELLVRKPFKGMIFVVDRVLKDCLEAGVIPDYVIILDASDKILSFIDHPIIDQYADRITAIMNAETSPKVVNRWKGKIYWYHVLMEELFAPNITHILELLLGTTAIVSGGHCTSIGWALAVMKRFEPIVIIGCDLSWPSDQPLETTRAFPWYLEQVTNGNHEEAKKLFDNHYHHNFFNTDCYYELIFKSYITVARYQFEHTQGIRIYNCTGGGALEGNGIECMWLEDYLNSQ